MKVWIKQLSCSVLAGLVVPGILLNYGVLYQKYRVLSEGEETASLSVREEPLQMTVSVRDDAGVVTAMAMEDYLVGVVLAEMPAGFGAEALKAQSVVARTYARKASLTGGKHGDSGVCTDPSCCQGYCPEETYLERGGTREDVERVRTAVMATSGQVLLYEGELIEATYFSCSGGTTEAAVAVWGREFPYLQSVESPGEEQAAYYRDSVSFFSEELERLLEITLPEAPENWVEQISYTEGGGVETIDMGGKCFRGTEFRQLLGLRSTAFTVHPRKDHIVITTRGYGHRVGMSQYGADAMAAEGSDFAQILQHYYPGTELGTAMP